MTRAKWEKEGTRSLTEQAARGSARAVARKNGTFICKVHKTHVSLAPCPKWPDGLVTAFHGWVDLHHRLVSCDEMPDLVTDGIYIRQAESKASALAAQSIAKSRLGAGQDYNELCLGAAAG